MRALGHDGGWGGRFGKWALERWGLLNIQYVFCFAWKGIDKRGKITLHLLFGWSLDKDEKSLDQSKQFS